MDVVQKHANYQFKILCISIYTKNEKSVDPNMYIFRSPNFIRFCHFYTAYNTNYFALRFSMLLGYIIGYDHFFWF